MHVLQHRRRAFSIDTSGSGFSDWGLVVALCKVYRGGQVLLEFISLRVITKALKTWLHSRVLVHCTEGCWGGRQALNIRAPASMPPLTVQLPLRWCTLQTHTYLLLLPWLVG